MREIISSGATTILVSHSIEQVREMCNKVLWIEKGNQIGFGDTELLCDLYQGYLDGTVSLDEAKAKLGTTDGIVRAEDNFSTEQFSSKEEKKLTTRPERDLSVDLAKTFAIGAVLLIHCNGSQFARFEIGSLSWLAADFFGSVGRWPVPLFLMCSGAIMNDPAKSIPLKKLFSKYLLRLFLFLAASSLLYDAVDMLKDVLKTQGTASILEFLVRAGRNLIYGNSHYHLYFFWFIFALYLALPLTRLVTRFASEQEYQYILLAFFVCGAILPFFQFYFPVNQMRGSLLYYVLPAALFCPGLGLIGWYLRCHPPERLLGSILLYLGGLVVTFVGLWIRSSQRGVLDELYISGFSPFVLIMAIAVFRLCQSFAACAHPYVQRTARFLSAASFIVYLIHPLFQEALAPDWFLSQPVYIAVPIQWLMLMGLSLLTYLIVHRLFGPTNKLTK